MNHPPMGPHAGPPPIPHPAHPGAGGWPLLRRKPQAVVVPIIVVVIGSLVAGMITLVTLSGTASQGHAAIGLIALAFSTVVASVGIVYLNWLDRWEPEPPLLLVSAFLWGGGVSLIFTLVFTIPALGLPEACRRPSSLH